MNVYGPFTRAAVFLCLMLAVGLSASSLAAQKTTVGSSKGGSKIAIEQCKTKNPDFTDSECATWSKRSDYVRDIKCPDIDATVACKSFRELVAAQDADLMNDLAKQDHVYACFRPEQDVFAEVVYSDPGIGIWDPERGSPGVVSHPGIATISYYKAGIRSQQMSLHDDGKWSYEPVGSTVNTVALHVPSASAIFKGDNIRIQGSRFDATETYKTADGLATTHTFVLQLSTGRFSETYEIQAPDTTVYSGRCFVLPAAE